MTDLTPTTPVIDRRPNPPGVLPRHAQTWIMAGLAAAILGIIAITGRPEAPDRPSRDPASPLAPSPDRLRDYQDRLRVLDERARQQGERDMSVPPPPPADRQPEPTAIDPLQDERRRREYESLFTSNVVFSRRLSPPSGGRTAATTTASTTPMDAMPSIDEVAAAVLRAASPDRIPAASPTAPSPNPAAPGDPPATRQADGPTTPTSVWMHRLVEGTVIDTVLTNRLDGAQASPVNCLVTNPVYANDEATVVIPAGSRFLGHTVPVQAQGESRLAVTFHRLVFPNGRTVPLQSTPGLNALGDTGLKDQVNRHHWSTFALSGAMGVVSGLAQLVGSMGWSRGGGDRSVIVAGGADASAQAASQVASRLLNRVPTITIREGHRVKVYLTADLELPADHGRQPRVATHTSPHRSGGRP